MMKWFWNLMSGLNFATKREQTSSPDLPSEHNVNEVKATDFQLQVVSFVDDAMVCYAWDEDDDEDDDWDDEDDGDDD